MLLRNLIRIYLSDTPKTTKFNAESLLMLPVSTSIVSICESGYAAHDILPNIIY